MTNTQSRSATQPTPAGAAEVDAERPVRRATESVRQAEVPPAGQQVLAVDPATLLVDVDVRHDARVGEDFCASIAEHGVLVPVVAVRTTDGALRVRFGHRRTLAAVQVGCATVPVVVVADEATDDAASVERLMTQWAENEHRSGLTTAERADVIGQLSAFGVSPTQIARRTRATKAEVAAALTLGGSELARAATARYDFLDLAQAATIAEFDHDTEAVKALVVAARDGQFDHVAQRLRDERTAIAHRTAAADRLREQGVRVIEPRSSTDPARSLRTLTDSQGTELDADAHAACPGHAAYIAECYGWLTTDGQPLGDEDADGAVGERRWGSVPRTVFVCTDPAAHGHLDRWPTSVAGVATASRSTR